MVPRNLPKYTSLEVIESDADELKWGAGKSVTVLRGVAG
jgi:hypothetical protein